MRSGLSMCWAWQAAKDRRLELSVCEGFGHFGSVASALLLCAAALVALVGLLGGACWWLAGAPRRRALSGLPLKSGSDERGLEAVGRVAT